MRKFVNAESQNAGTDELNDAALAAVTGGDDNKTYASMLNTVSTVLRMLADTQKAIIANIR